jgi:hypothetical protein
MDTEALAEFDRYTPDELSELYKNDPALFDELAVAVISQACIGHTEEATLLLHQIQWVIDGQLRKGKTPLQRLHIMENIFYGRIFGDDGELAHLAHSWNDLLGDLRRFERICMGKALSVLKKSGETDEIRHQSPVSQATSR